MNPRSPWSVPSLIAAATALAALTTNLEGAEVTYPFYRFTPTELRNDASANSVQLSEVEFYLQGDLVLDSVPLPFVTNPGGDNPGGEGPGNVVDGNTSTKWLDFFKGELVIEFDAPVTIDGYSWATANDALERDPISWVLAGSDDGIEWDLLDAQDGYPTPELRFELLPEFPIPDGPAPVPPRVRSFVADPPIVTPGQSSTLRWEVESATTVRVDPGVGGVDATGASTVNPTETRTYTLEAGNASGTVTADATVTVREPAALNYAFLRFVPTELRADEGANSVQIAELNFFFEGAEVIPVDAINPGGSNPAQEGPENAIDGNDATKWLDFNRQPLEIDFGGAVDIDAYRITTANDAPQRDPVSWMIEGSDDGFSWVTVEVIEHFPTPVTRFEPTQAIPFGGLVFPPQIGSFTADLPLVVAGETVNLAWVTAGADTVVLEPGGIVVPPTGSRAVAVPTGETTYTLRASNDDGVSEATVVVAGLAGDAVTYQYFRWTPLELRDDAGANSVQLAELEFSFQGTPVTGAFVDNFGGDNPAGEEPDFVADGDVGTKWLDFNRSALEFDFGGPVVIDRYALATANDSPGRDPVSWTLEGSTDGFEWVLLSDVDGYPVPEERFLYTPNLPLGVAGGNGGGGLPEVRIVDVTYDAGAGEVELRWTSQPAAVYRVFRSTDLTVWVEESDVVSGGAETTERVRVGAGERDVYFQIRQD